MNKNILDNLNEALVNSKSSWKQIEDGAHKIRSGEYKQADLAATLLLLIDHLRPLYGVSEKNVQDVNNTIKTMLNKLNGVLENKK